jgi:hypothetical protein
MSGSENMIRVRVIGPSVSERPPGPIMPGLGPPDPNGGRTPAGGPDLTPDRGRDPSPSI